MSDKIKGGFYLKARQVQKSDIATAPPHVREIWDWLLLNSNYKDHGPIKRGQLFCTYSGITDGLCWYVGYIRHCYKKHHVETALNWLTVRRMIRKQRTTRGIIITILNYNKYQNPKNYETDNETESARNQPGITPDTIRKESMKESNNNNTGEKFDPFFHRPEWISEKDWTDIIKQRRSTKKSKETERAYNAIIEQLSKAVSKGFTVKECVDKMCNRGWYGFEADWMNSRDKQKQPIEKETSASAARLLGGDYEQVAN